MEFVYELMYNLDDNSHKKKTHYITIDFKFMKDLKVEIV